jgi:phage terminase large subunit-like protein
MSTAHAELALLLEEQARRQSRRRLDTYFPDTGPLRRELYQKHLHFFRLGATHRTRLFMAAHRVGKTEGAGAYETALHMTGQYPRWWEGRRFDRPVRWWAAGQTGKTTRDILQLKLLGPVGEFGTGLIPGDALVRTTPKAGLPDAIESAYVRHTSGRDSLVIFKSYDQGPIAFTGTEQDGILLDEEPPLAINAQCVLRTMTTGGVILLTFTPLQGLSETVLHYLPDGDVPPDGPLDASTAFVNASWDDVPHLSEAAKAELLKALPPYLRDAASRGLPLLGAGAIYPVPEDDYLVDPFDLPPHWLRAYGLDVGWNRTAAVWGAYDREADTWYLYHEHYRGQAEPSVHAQAIKAPGEWQTGVVDPAARGRSQTDGAQLLDTYQDLGLKLEPAENAVESGLYQVWERLSSGRLKIFRSLSNWRKEARLYRRDEKGHIVKKDDHLMDATRYLILSGRDVAKAVPVPKAARAPRGRGGPGSWMA